MHMLAMLTCVPNSLGSSQDVEEPCRLRAAELAALMGCAWLSSSRKTMKNEKAEEKDSSENRSGALP